MVLFTETPNETDTVKGIIEDLNRTKARLRALGQRLNDAKEQLFVPFDAVAKILRKIIPDYKSKKWSGGGGPWNYAQNAQ
eukprot:14644378-Heterocapsa_arctica.AAC.1